MTAKTAEHNSSTETNHSFVKSTQQTVSLK